MLFKESMLNSLLQGIGQRLDKKPFTWMSWWRGKKWISVFLIVPKLSEEQPLWKRDGASLRSLLLFNLEPSALQAEIHAYWRKDFWQRWWSGLFTSINNKIKVWSYSKKAETAIEQAKKNAVHGIIFKGFPSKERLSGQKALAQNPNLEEVKSEFFKEFFQDGGKYLKFVTLVNNGAIASEDRIKIGKEYKIGVIVSVNVAALRKDLEDAGIIKSLSNGF